MTSFHVREQSVKRDQRVVHEYKLRVTTSYFEDSWLLDKGATLEKAFVYVYAAVKHAIFVSLSLPENISNNTVI